jgi:hypothetical protein
MCLNVTVVRDLLLLLFEIMNLTIIIIIINAGG